VIIKDFLVCSLRCARDANKLLFFFLSLLACVARARARCVSRYDDDFS
jgi:hypothetical protein